MPMIFKWWIPCVGGLVCKKPADPLDAPPFVIGCITLLKQQHVDNTDKFLALMGQYVRSFVDAMPGWVIYLCNTDNL